MTSTSNGQLDLLATGGAKDDQRAEVLLGLTMSQDAFLKFLAEEWLPLSEGNLFMLGADAGCSTGPVDADSVTVWFDPTRLPATTVMVWRGREWHEASTRSWTPNDSVVALACQLPLFAVHHFSVGSENVRMKLLAFSRSFADINVPVQPFEVALSRHVEPPAEKPQLSVRWQPPENWDALRGAAATAAFAVPAIDPWVELLCQWFRDGVAHPELTDRLRVPWLRAAPWTAAEEVRNSLPGLWRAAVEEFSAPGRLREWRPKNVLSAICDRAMSLDEAPKRLQSFYDGAIKLLNDLGTVAECGARDDDLALSLQLLLLRSSPERFASWREDFPAIPPGAWWTGMILSGYLQGFRALPKQFRGTPDSRLFVALSTWEYGAPDGSGPWRLLAPERADWQMRGESFSIEAGPMHLLAHKIGTRGRWYQADFDSEAVRQRALLLAREAVPQAVSSVLTLVDTAVPYFGTGSLAVDTKKRELTVKGRVDLQVGRDLQFEERLDVERFQEWLATASIKSKLPKIAPVGGLPEEPRADLQLPIGDAEGRNLTDASHKKAASVDKPKRASAMRVVETPPAGLEMLEDFISASQELELVEAIDSGDWSTELRRRVQHYGWRYDYKARGIAQKDYLGPLPSWAEELAQKLFDEGLFPEVPDQVIVNNYDGPQGISKHIDCPDCFRGPVATISLLETWDMIFTRKVPGETLKFVQPLPRRSVALLAGEARSRWLHEIPMRQTEYKRPRVRRISVTFRKVDADAPEGLR
ncbi:alpha-ketoglutarate-dependent dioxygenase AlkB [Curvibacter lanceolatus]|uniref:alpha-ketoglutarate-dependent dioxygenase AlkB n=1 Tax=Curvibacter lanceolatus TaxID=86182 RepID=UPI00037B064B|nr:alpha-ketoglutarate-dependent dioxygenase AlkB [Curvibacter lanceolatus]